MNALHEAARSYAQRGWPVFPCAPRAKHPACIHGLHDATTDLTAIDEWWSKNAAFNIGLPTGIVFDALDLDTTEARVWARMQGIANRPEVETGRGLHVYVNATGFGNRTALYPNVDYRGRGGYVLAPPSIHPTGTPYRWRSGCAPRSPVPSAPRWLFHLLAGEQRSARPERRRGEDASSDVVLSARGVASLRAMAEQLASCEQGRRNSYLFWAACTAADTGIDQADVDIVLRAAAQRAGLGDTEITRTLCSAFGRWQ